MTLKTDQKAILSALAEGPLSLSELMQLVPTQASPSTIRRRLKDLEADGLIDITGEKKGTRYVLKVHTPERVTPHGYERQRLDNYVPNQSSYLTPQQLDVMHALGQTGRANEPAGTYARDIMERLLIDLSWASSQLEGNTYSLLETRELIQHGREATGKDARETQMVLNHKYAIEFLVNSAADLSFKRHLVFNTHAILLENLLADPASLGAIRQRPVGVTGARYIPLSDPHQISELFEQILAVARQIDDPFEAGVFVFLHLSFLQPFLDGNKRTARMALNFRMFRDNLKPVSFVEIDREDYLRRKLTWYDEGDYRPLLELIVDAYEVSAARYDMIVEEIQPDPFYLVNRSLIHEVVRAMVVQLVEDLEEFADTAAVDRFEAGPDRARFVAAVLTQIRSLHEGNYARLQIRPSEFERWQAFQQTK